MNFFILSQNMSIKEKIRSFTQKRPKKELIICSLLFALWIISSITYLAFYDIVGPAFLGGGNNNDWVGIPLIALSLFLCGYFSQYLYPSKNSVKRFFGNTFFTLLLWIPLVFFGLPKCEISCQEEPFVLQILMQWPLVLLWMGLLFMETMRRIKSWMKKAKMTRHQNPGREKSEKIPYAFALLGSITLGICCFYLLTYNRATIIDFLL